MMRAPRGHLAIPLGMLLIAASAGAGVRARGVDKLQPRLRAAIASAGPSTPVLAWVRFTDRGVHEAEKAAPPRSLVSPRSLQRRAKVLPPQHLVDATDLPVDESYVRAVAGRVSQVRQRSKWFNAVSVLATGAQLEDVQSLPMVRSIEPVTRYRQSAPPPTIAPPLGAGAVPAPPRAGTSPGSPRPRTPALQALDYGLSLHQLQIMNVPALHAQGITGQGVLIGHFDDGYRLLSHEALASLHIVAAYDFVDHEPNPAPPLGDPNAGSHGISTLSVLGGYKPSVLIGPAFGADFVLARTEDDASETPLEEDNWVAAIEWADSLGIDVASTSLGYLDFDPGYTSLTWQDMNGHTSIMTRAADMAVARGIVVVNAAGNEGENALHNTLIVPSDGDSVIAVGGTDEHGVRYISSSVGPTTDQPPRIKPDVMAQGSMVWIAGTGSETNYAYSAGTSFACPLAAGVAALLLSAVPNSTPMQIRDALRLTASRAGNPDNDYGWGMVNAPAALAHLQLAVQATSWTAAKGLYR